MKEMFRMVDKSKVDEVKQMLEYTQKGTAKATVGNYMVVLRNDPLVRESMKYNKLTGRIDIVKKLWWNEKVCKLDDDGRTYFYYFFERYYKLTSEKCMDKALRIEANSRAYHPICEYLEQLEWDGQERIRYVLQRYMGADASDFVYEVVKHFLMEALSRIYRPGCKADEMLCLVGQQGAGKSTFFRFLALNDDWFSDDLKQLNDSKIYEHLRGHWIMEMSEMIAAISAKSNEEIKSFLTRQKDTYRNPYDKYEEDRKRQCIFAGSTNTRQFIPFDRTGARRFLPIAIDSSKAEKHILDDEKEARSYFDQLWAEVMEIYWQTPLFRIIFGSGRRAPQGGETTPDARNAGRLAENMISNSRVPGNNGPKNAYSSTAAGSVSRRISSASPSMSPSAAMCSPPALSGLPPTS